jgi:cell division protein FtsB
MGTAVAHDISIPRRGPLPRDPSPSAQDVHDRAGARSLPRGNGCPTSRDASRARSTFLAFSVLFAGLVVVMAATVAVRTDCARNAYRLTELTQQLTAERQATEALQVRMLSMGTPGRIEAIASSRLSMVEPEEITFLRRPLPVQRAAPRREAPRRRSDALASVSGWLRRTAQDFTILSLGELGLPPAGT